MGSWLRKKDSEQENRVLCNVKIHQGDGKQRIRGSVITANYSSLAIPKSIVGKVVGTSFN